MIVRGGTVGKASTVYDVAKHAGVSIATVSRVLRRPDDVRASTRERVMRSVRELGYVPSGSARGLAARRTGVIGLYFAGFDAVDESAEVVRNGGARVIDDVGGGVEPHPTNLYLDEVLRGAELEAWRKGFVLLVGVGRGENAAETVRDMAGRVDGMLMLAQGIPDAELIMLAERVPVVILAGDASEESLDHVAVSNAEGMRALTDHLVRQRDVRAITYIAGPADSPDAAARWAGLTAALAELGRDSDEVTVLRGAFTRGSGYEHGRAIVAGDSLPDAVVCGNDQMALGVLDAFAEIGISVPGDVIVTGFDGIESASASKPRLTTVRQRMHDVGRAGVDLMQRRLEDPEAEPMSVVLPVEVVLRESSEGERGSRA